MKKLLLVIFALLSSFEINAQTSIGKYVMFPNAKFMGSFYKPQLSFGLINGKNYLVLRCCQSQGYATFDAYSRLLIGFEDETVVKLPMDWGEGVQTSYDNEYDSFTHNVVEFFKTYTSYPIEQETINAILSGNKIIKIRVAFSNGNVMDYDITPKYQSKLIEGLKESYEITKASDEQKRRNSTDEDF